MKAAYFVVKVMPDKVFIADTNDGRMSVTNDAEAVVADVHSKYPGCRIIYKDTDERWDELLHNKGVFRGFGMPYTGELERKLCPKCGGWKPDGNGKQIFSPGCECASETKGKK